MKQMLTLVILAMGMASCGTRIPKPAGLPPGVPHVSWIIMHGDRENPDTEFACQSTGPRECVLPVSRPDARVFSDVHLYFHGVGRETTYRGTFRLEFLGDGDSTRRDFPVETVVRGDEKIANHAVTGIVTAKPGAYTFRLAIEASVAGGSTPIHEDVAVQVQ